ncbi:MAG TPA: TolC family outer membrane protein [Steroidobacteraceae bacterium]|nr:TolC family outer membrane protein [Steroidobacteraceae bacterium]
MKRSLLVLACCLAWSCAPAADLLAVYQRALQNDPQLKEAEANRLAALEAKPQALAALLPQISGSGTISREKDKGQSNETETVIADGQTITEAFPFNGRVTTNTHKYGVDLSQNLFSWQNWVALQRADAQVAQAEADYQAAQQDLMARVAERYFDVLAAQDDLDAQRANLESVNHQVQQAEKRYQVGLIAVTDVEEARAAHDSGAAAVIASKRQLASAQELLREITGDAFDYLARPIEPFELAAPDPSSEDRWVEMALQQNLSLVSSRLAADIARDNVNTARGGHFPTLDLVASRYKNSVGGDYVNANDTPYGTTTLDQYQNVIGIQLSIPIYSGGMVSSQVRQAVYLHRAAKERVERVARQTEHDARDAYLGVLSEISHVSALRRALESNATALRATESGYEAGTRTAVDVVESRRLWIQARTDYSRSRYDYMVNMVKLQQAAGILTEQSLSRLNALLKDEPPQDQPSQQEPAADTSSPSPGGAAPDAGLTDRASMDGAQPGSH